MQFQLNQILYIKTNYFKIKIMAKLFFRRGVDEVTETFEYIESIINNKGKFIKLTQIYKHEFSDEIEHFKKMYNKKYIIEIKK